MRRHERRRGEVPGAVSQQLIKVVCGRGDADHGHRIWPSEKAMVVWAICAAITKVMGASSR
jgi:hypothetical protein